jgi:predicted membrane chloride channel (bestrophin family)
LHISVDAFAVVVGLLLAIRTDKAYDKYYEGRALFCNMWYELLISRDEINLSNIKGNKFY